MIFKLQFLQNTANGALQRTATVFRRNPCAQRLDCAQHKYIGRNYLFLRSVSLYNVHFHHFTKECTLAIIYGPGVAGTTHPTRRGNRVDAVFVEDEK